MPIGLQRSWEDSLSLPLEVELQSRTSQSEALSGVVECLVEDVSSCRISGADPGVWSLIALASGLPEFTKSVRHAQSGTTIDKLKKVTTKTKDS